MRLAAVLFLIIASVLIAPPVSAQARDSDSLPTWVTEDTPAKTVHLTLEAKAGPEPGTGTLNGLDHGRLQLVVPLGWTVQWSWRNADSSQSHSLVLMAEREKLPNEGGRPVFSNAMSRMVAVGLKPGQRDETTFVAEEAGWYWLLCGVPGHAIKGEWLGLKVDRVATGVAVRWK